jgi:hypothetical protein
MATADVVIVDVACEGATVAEGASVGWEVAVDAAGVAVTGVRVIVGAGGEAWWQALNANANSSRRRYSGNFAGNLFIGSLWLNSSTAGNRRQCCGIVVETQCWLT